MSFQLAVVALSRILTQQDRIRHPECARNQSDEEALIRFCRREVGAIVSIPLVFASPIATAAAADAACCGPQWASERPIPGWGHRVGGRMQHTAGAAFRQAMRPPFAPSGTLVYGPRLRCSPRWIP